MEIETIVFERWMCRICLQAQPVGRHNIFEDHLVPPAAQQQNATEKPPQGRSNNSVSIVDALNCFCEFKISPTEIVNEPIMLCEGCCAALHQAYQFRIKLNESECLLRSRDGLDCVIDDDDDVVSTKTGLTLQLDEIEPFLEEEPEDISPPKPLKVHHAKPRFQLTNQVSNILRHVAASSGPEKRKDPDEPSLDAASTPKKIPRRNEPPTHHLDKTLIVPNYIFASELAEDGQREKTILLVQPTAVSPSNPAPPEPPEVDTIAYCKHCPKAFSTPRALLAHTKSTHLCQHCLQHLPTAAERNRHIREAHRTFRCTLCDGFRTPYVANLRSHLRRAHAVALPAHVSILQQMPSPPGEPGAIPEEANK